METSDNVKSIFHHEAAPDIAKAFTELWMQLINDKEESKGNILQTGVSGL